MFNSTSWKKCFRQVPSIIASYLKLADAKLYTGHCMRRTSATLLADSDADLTTIKRLGGWKSGIVAEGYIGSSTQRKTLIANNENSENEASTSRDEATASRTSSRWQ